MNTYRSMADLIRDCAQKDETIRRLIGEKRELAAKLFESEAMLEGVKIRESLPLPAVNYPPCPIPSLPALGAGVSSLSDAHLGQLLDQVRTEIWHMRNIRDKLQMLLEARAARQGGGESAGGISDTPANTSGL